MGKRKKEAALMGRSVIKDRFKGKNRNPDSFVHVAELKEEQQSWSVQNLRSITQQSNLEDFLTAAQLAGRSFTAERDNAKIVTNTGSFSPLSAESIRHKQAIHDSLRHFLRIPRKPAWDETTTKEQLEQSIRESFLVWRRQLALMQQENEVVVTPYEKNLAFWKELWSTIERSDVVVQIVDARNPLLFYCRDLESYVTEVNALKQTLVLVNKADFLSAKQREAWAQYFQDQGVRAVFWSATNEKEKQETAAKALKEAALKMGTEELANDDNDDDDNTDDGDDSDEASNVEDLDASSEDSQGNYADQESDSSLDEDQEKLHSSILSGVSRTEKLDTSKHCDTELESDLKTTTSPQKNVNDESSTVKDRGDKAENVDGHRTNENKTDDHRLDRMGFDVDSRGDNTNTASSLKDSRCDFDTIGGNGIDSERMRTSSEVAETFSEKIRLMDDPSSSENTTPSQTSSTTEASVLQSMPSSERGPCSVVNSASSPQSVDSSWSAGVASLPGALLNGEELFAVFRQAAKTCSGKKGLPVIGMVGYPNVGKSSTINALMQRKKVAVSATPGRTKTIQTLEIGEEGVWLCDCPGLVFPSFVNSKADLVVNGILPVDQLIGWEQPTALVCERMGRKALMETYHINLPAPDEGQAAEAGPSVQDLLHTYGLMRGFMTHKGNPDRPRSARYILKDYVNGRLLYCHPPPGIPASDFNKPPYAQPKAESGPLKQTPMKSRSEKKAEILNQEFFTQCRVRGQTQGRQPLRDFAGAVEHCRASGGPTEADSSSSASSLYGSQSLLPRSKKHHNKKREKSRRVYADLDQHQYM